MDLVDCPECGLPAEVVERFDLASTDGPVPHLRIKCVRSVQFVIPAYAVEAQ